jgi:hypothetical protein
MPSASLWSKHTVEGEIFCSHLDQPWGPPGLLYNGYWVSFLEVKQPGHGVEHQHPSSTKVKKRIELYLMSPSGPSWNVLGWNLYSEHLLLSHFGLKAHLFKNWLFFCHQIKAWNTLLSPLGGAHFCGPSREYFMLLSDDRSRGSFWNVMLLTKMILYKIFN